MNLCEIQKLLQQNTTDIKNIQKNGVSSQGEDASIINSIVGNREIIHVPDEYSDSIEHIKMYFNEFIDNYMEEHPDITENPKNLFVTSTRLPGVEGGEKILLSTSTRSGYRYIEDGNIYVYNVELSKIIEVIPLEYRFVLFCSMDRAGYANIIFDLVTGQPLLEKDIMQVNTIYAFEGYKTIRSLVGTRAVPSQYTYIPVGEGLIFSRAYLNPKLLSNKSLEDIFSETESGSLGPISIWVAHYNGTTIYITLDNGLLFQEVNPSPEQVIIKVANIAGNDEYAADLMLGDFDKVKTIISNEGFCDFKIYKKNDQGLEILNASTINYEYNDGTEKIIIIIPQSGVSYLKIEWYPNNNLDITFNSETT